MARAFGNLESPGGSFEAGFLRGVTFEALTCLDVRPNMRGIDAPHL
jgi:hypothetical protein